MSLSKFGGGGFWFSPLNSSQRMSHPSGYETLWQQYMVHLKHVPVHQKLSLLAVLLLLLSFIFVLFIFPVAIQEFMR